MIRMVEMSVLLGIKSRWGAGKQAQKKGAHTARPSNVALGISLARGVVFRPDSATAKGP
jgi:hypothetical protein